MLRFTYEDQEFTTEVSIQLVSPKKGELIKEGEDYKIIFGFHSISFS